MRNHWHLRSALAATLASLAIILLAVRAQATQDLQDDLVWIEGRVVLPDGLPDGEEVLVESRGRKLATGERPVAAVGSDGRFKIGVPSGGFRVPLGVKADHLYQGRSVRVNLRRPPSLVELRPQLGVKIVVQLVTDQEDTSFWNEVEVVLDSLVGQDDFLMWDASSRASAGSGLLVEFPGIEPADQYSITVVPVGGVVTEQGGIRVAPGGDRLITVKVTEGARISGLVLDEEGQPLPRTRLKLRMGIAESGTQQFHYTRADEDGRFNISAIPTASLRLELEAGGYTDGRLMLGKVKTGDHIKIGAVTLSTGSHLVVEVVWPDGTPVEASTVALAGSRHRRVERTQHIRGHQLEFTGLGRGPFIVAARSSRAEGVGRDQREREYFGRLEAVQANTTARVILERGVLVEGRVEGQGGRAIDGCRLRVTPADTKEPPFFPQEVSAGQDGSFVLDLPPGQWKVSADGAGYGTQVIEVPSRTPISVVVTRAATLTGTVLDPNGNRVPDALLFFRYREGKGGTVVQGETSSDGTWSIELPPGVVWVEARIGGLSSGDLLRLEGKPGQVVGPVELVVE